MHVFADNSEAGRTNRIYRLCTDAQAVQETEEKTRSPAGETFTDRTRYHTGQLS